jgi:hypothetical protein
MREDSRDFGPAQARRMALAIEDDKAFNPVAKSQRRAGVVELDLDCVADAGKKRDGRNRRRKMEPFGPRIADRNRDFRELSATALSYILSNLGEKPGGSRQFYPAFSSHTSRYAAQGRAPGKRGSGP